MKPTTHSERSQIVVVPPRGAAVPGLFKRPCVNPDSYYALLAAIQRFRGRVYLDDGAITPQELSADGRHILPIDAGSWHIVAQDADGRVCGCGRFSEESACAKFEDLWIRHAALAQCEWGTKLRRAVEHLMTQARSERLHFGEVGGWAIAKERRGGRDALRILFMTYGLMELLGGCIGLATATTRHGSTQILQRAGFGPLATDGAALPSYYDAQYGCEMQVLQFDSRHANPKFMNWVSESTEYLRTAPVVMDTRSCRSVTRQQAPVLPRQPQTETGRPALSTPVLA